MKKTTTGLMVGVAGVALLAGGATFALWGDAATVPGGTLTSGEFAIASTGGQWSDLSNGTAAAIDPVTFRTVPGDELQLTQTATIIATGDNMSATLTAAGGASSADLLAQGVTVTYSIFKGVSTTPVIGGDSVPLGDTANIDIVKTDADGDNYTIKIDAAFANSTADQDTTGASLNLGDVTFTMNQVRA